MGPHRPQQRPPERRCGADLQHLAAVLGNAVADRSRTIDQHGLARLFPDGHIRPRIAGVGEIPATGQFADAPQLGLAFQIGFGVAANGLIEQPEMLANLIGAALVRRRDQRHPAPAGALFPQPGKHFGIVRQAGGIKDDAAGKLLLEPGAAPQQPKWNREQVQRIAPHQPQRRLEQQIGADQRAVEIDEQMAVGLSRHRPATGPAGGGTARVPVSRAPPLRPGCRGGPRVDGSLPRWGLPVP